MFRGDVLTYMVSQGYKHIGTIGIDDMFIKPDKVNILKHLQKLSKCIFYSQKGTNFLP